MQESSTPQQDHTPEQNHPAGQEAPKRSGLTLPLLLIILVIVAGFYWYLNTPRVATFENKAIATFNANHNFDSPGLKEYGSGVVVLAPSFVQAEDDAFVDLLLTVWAKQPGKVVQVKEIQIEGLSLPAEQVALLSPADVESGLLFIEAPLKKNIPVEDLIEAAKKSGGKLKLKLKADVRENVPQLRVHPQDITYEFDVRSQHVTPWSK